jgi:hypothetical protein
MAHKCYQTPMRLEDRFGSKGEILAASKCFPLFPRQRTFNRATVRACRKRAEDATLN